MSSPLTLVVGATGHVGSQVARRLAERGHPVRALVRRAGVTIHDAPPGITYAEGDLRDPASLERALDGVTAVVSTANAIIPSGGGRGGQPAVGAGYDALIGAAEAAGVQRFVQASVPVHPLERSVPELAAKRAIERRLASSPMETVVVRNPAFTDVWLVMLGARQAMGPDPHATTRRPFGFMQTWQRLTGDLVVKRGRMLAPGGPDHGAPLITTRDVALALATMVDHPGPVDPVVELPGPEWVSWRELARLLSEHAGRTVRPLSMPAGLARAGRRLLAPIAPAASGVLALTEFVATWQPRWESAPVVQRYGLPRQTTVAEYLDRVWPTSDA